MENYSKEDDSDEVVTNNIIMGNILYQLGLRVMASFEKALEFGIQNNLREFAMNIVFELLDKPQSYANVIAQKNLRAMIEKGWLLLSSMKR